jgi:hypothetical protein
MGIINNLLGYLPAHSLSLWKGEAWHQRAVIGRTFRERERPDTSHTNRPIMNTICRLISHPVFYQVQDLLLEGDVQLNKELLLLARHMGLAQGYGNFHTLTQNAMDRLSQLLINKGSHPSLLGIPIFNGESV